jgi:hypothetical protein
MMRRIALILLLLLLSTAAAAQLRVWVEPDRHTVKAGSQFRTVGHASGGNGPYRFEWYIGNERTGEVNQAKIWKINSPGHFLLRVVVLDANGKVGEGQGRVEVLPFFVSMQPDPVARGMEGERIHFMVVPSGMTPPYRLDLFVDDGPAAKPIKCNDRQRIFVSSKRPGMHQVDARITDACGLVVWARASYWVGAGGPSEDQLNRPHHSDKKAAEVEPGSGIPPGGYPPEDVDTDFEF